MVDMGNFDIKLADYFKLFFIVTKLGDLDTVLGVILNYVS